MGVEEDDPPLLPSRCSVGRRQWHAFPDGSACDAPIPPCRNAAGLSATVRLTAKQAVMVSELGSKVHL